MRSSNRAGVPCLRLHLHETRCYMQRRQRIHIQCRTNSCTRTQANDSYRPNTNNQKLYNTTLKTKQQQRTTNQKPHLAVTLVEINVPARRVKQCVHRLHSLMSYRSQQSYMSRRVWGECVSVRVFWWVGGYVDAQKRHSVSECVTRRSYLIVGCVLMCVELRVRKMWVMWVL